MDLIRRGLDALRNAFARKAGLLRVVALVLSVLVMTAATPNAAEACGIDNMLSCVAMVFVKIFQLLTALMGWILVLEVEAVIRVAQYFNFVSPGPAAVQLGWVVTRDLANMFFIVMLLIIAFGTIVGSATYHYSKNLQRLLIMAIVINFSKTICGIFIDMGQVVMLTFVNGFKETAAGNFMNAYQINKLLALGNSGNNDYTFGMVVAMMFAFILAAIAVCVTLVLLVMLLFRVVMLWVLIILSPLAFLASAIPGANKYYVEWWGKFKKQIMGGPVIAFFMWLALASVQQVGPGGFAGQGFPATYAGSGESAAAANATAGGAAGSGIPTQAGTADTIMNMIIAIAIMFAGLQQAAESGAAGSGFANTMRSGITKAGRAVASGGIKYATQPLLTGGGRQLAKVPLIGGLGRAAVLTGEKWKKERQASAEKFSGGPEDLARLSPGAFNRSLKSLSSKGNIDGIDKKRLDSMVRTGLANPKIAAGMGATGDGAFAVNQLIASSSGKGLQDAAGLLMTDKNVNKWAKDDPTFLQAAYQKVKSAAETDPNLKKTQSEMEQKFASQLVSGGMMDASRLKEIAPKMSGEDVMGLAAGDMATFMPHMTSNQLKKLTSDGTPDQQAAMLASLKDDQLGKLNVSDLPASWYGDAKVADFVLDKTRNDPKARGEAMGKGGAALVKRADERLAAAMTAGPNGGVDSAQFLAALPDAITVGSLDVEKIKGNGKLQAAVTENASRIDLQALAKNISVSDGDRSGAGKAVATLVGGANFDKLKNASKSGMAEHILPSKEEMAAIAEATAAKAAQATASARAGQTASLNSEAPQMLEDLGKQLAALQASAASAPSQAANEEIGKLTGAIEQLQQSVARRDEAIKSLEGMRERIGFAQGNKDNPATLPMPPAQLEALKTAADNFEKRLNQLDTAIAKTVADVKGVKFDSGDAGKQNRANNRMNNRSGNRQG